MGLKNTFKHGFLLSCIYRDVLARNIFGPEASHFIWPVWFVWYLFKTIRNSIVFRTQADAQTSKQNGPKPSADNFLSMLKLGPKKGELCNIMMYIYHIPQLPFNLLSGPWSFPMAINLVGQPFTKAGNSAGIGLTACRVVLLYFSKMLCHKIFDCVHLARGTCLRSGWSGFGGHIWQLLSTKFVRRNYVTQTRFWVLLPH